MAEERKQLWGGINNTSKTSRPGTLPAGEGQTESSGEDPQRTEGGGACPPLLRTAPQADSSAGTASFSPAPVQPEHQGAGPAATPPFASI